MMGGRYCSQGGTAGTQHKPCGVRYDPRYPFTLPRRLFFPYPSHRGVLSCGWLHILTLTRRLPFIIPLPFGPSTLTTCLLNPYPSTQPLLPYSLPYLLSRLSRRVDRWPPSISITSAGSLLDKAAQDKSATDRQTTRLPSSIHS